MTGPTPTAENPNLRPSAVQARARRQSGVRAGEVRRSLDYSIRDGMAWSVMAGAGAANLLPYVVHNTDDLFRIAAVGTLPSLAGALVQWGGAELIDRRGARQQMCVRAGWSQAAIWLPVCAAVFLDFSTAFWVILVAFVAYNALQSIQQPAWTSWMGDLIPARRRGNYLGQRGMLCGTVATAAVLLSGAWIDWAAGWEDARPLGLAGRAFAFLTMFALAGVARVVSTEYLTKMSEPAYQRRATDRFSLWQFIKRMPKGNYGRFVLYRALLHGAGMFQGPFVAWYILRELGYGQFWFSTFIALYMLMMHFLQPFWGRMVDRVGSKRVLAFGGIASVIIPLLFFVSAHPLWLAVVHVYDGFAFAAIAIAGQSYMFDIVTPPKRARCAAFSALFMAAAGVLGAFGGALAALTIATPLTLGPLTVESKFFVILLGSAVLRAVPNALLLWTFEDFRRRRRR